MRSACNRGSPAGVHLALAHDDHASHCVHPHGRGPRHNRIRVSTRAIWARGLRPYRCGLRAGRHRDGRAAYFP